MYTYTYMYMGKNFTLYINVPQFETEDNKSGLVSKLLLEHYQESKSTKVVQRTKRVVVDKEEPSVLKICKKGHKYIGDRCFNPGCMAW